MSFERERENPSGKHKNNERHSKLREREREREGKREKAAETSPRGERKEEQDNIHKEGKERKDGKAWRGMRMVLDVGKEWMN